MSEWPQTALNHMSTYVSTQHMFPYVSICCHMFPYVSICFHMFPYVSMHLPKTYQEPRASNNFIFGSHEVFECQAAASKYGRTSTVLAWAICVNRGQLVPSPWHNMQGHTRIRPALRSFPWLVPKSSFRLPRSRSMRSPRSPRSLLKSRRRRGSRGDASSGLSGPGLSGLSGLSGLADAYGCQLPQVPAMCQPCASHVPAMCHPSSQCLSVYSSVSFVSCLRT